MDSSNSNFGLDVGKIYFRYLIVWKTLFLIMIKYIYNHKVYFTRIVKAIECFLTVKNKWEFPTGHDGVGFMGSFCITPFTANPLMKVFFSK